MKQIFLYCILFFLSLSSIVAQSGMTDFFRYEGVKALAFLAHPTNDFKRGTYGVYTDRVVVEIFYYEDYYTKVELTRNGDFFTRIRVLEDNDIVPPFTAIWALKELLREFISSGDEQDKRVIGQFEQMVQSSVANMTGRDIACLITTLAWFAY